MQGYAVSVFSEDVWEAFAREGVAPPVEHAIDALVLCADCVRVRYAGLVDPSHLEGSYRDQRVTHAQRLEGIVIEIALAEETAGGCVFCDRGGER